jgi:hypothetical protein
VYYLVHLLSVVYIRHHICFSMIHSAFVGIFCTAVLQPIFCPFIVILLFIVLILEMYSRYFDPENPLTSNISVTSMSQ